MYTYHYVCLPRRHITRYFEQFSNWRIPYFFRGTGSKPNLVKCNSWVTKAIKCQSFNINWGFFELMIGEFCVSNFWVGRSCKINQWVAKLSDNAGYLLSPQGMMFRPKNRFSNTGEFVVNYLKCHFFVFLWIC